MVLSRIPEERRTIKYRNRASNYGTQHVPRNSKQSLYQNVSSRSASLTTAIANKAFTSTSSSTDDTLSMISTPWSTESWISPTESSYYSSSQGLTSSLLSSYSSSVEPKTRTTTSGCPSIDIKTGSNLTVTLLDKVLITPSVSRYVQPLNRHDSLSSPTYTSWSLETYTSTGVLSSFDRIKVNYPWSPSTFQSLDLTDNYPSTPTLISQKGSREGFGKFEPKKPFTPMNIVLSLDDHPLLDWILVKQQGIPVRKE